MDTLILKNEYDFLDSINLEALKLSFNPDFLLFSPKVQIHIETKNYILRTAERADLLGVFKLRHQTFIGDSDEFGERALEYDQFDFSCDHLVILHKETQAVCGTYRVITSDKKTRFYSATEFDITEFTNRPGVKIELGRACIDKSHQNGHTLDLLWKGIGAYALKVGAKYIFGTSSFFNCNKLELLRTISYLTCSDDLILNTGIKPLESIEYNQYELGQLIYEEDNVKSKIPALVKSYLKAGAKLYGQPFWDRSWDCFDFFTVIDVDNINSSYKKRYFKEGY